MNLAPRPPDPLAGAEAREAQDERFDIVDVRVKELTGNIRAALQKDPEYQELLRQMRARMNLLNSFIELHERVEALESSSCRAIQLHSNFSERLLQLERVPAQDRLARCQRCGSPYGPQCKDHPEQIGCTKCAQFSADDLRYIVPAPRPTLYAERLGLSDEQLAEMLRTQQRMPWQVRCASICTSAGEISFDEESQCVSVGGEKFNIAFLKHMVSESAAGRSFRLSRDNGAVMLTPIGPADMLEYNTGDDTYWIGDKARISAMALTLLKAMAEGQQVLITKRRGIVESVL